ncbi:MAG: hypothetical protein FWC03_00560 [Treponema sp.]|nr:hypothetical protein [Treponema sp.]
MGIKLLLESFIPHGLHELSRKHLTKNIFNAFRIKFFKKIITRENSCCIIEFTPFHGENFPSLTKYLLDLGYNVDVVYRKPLKKKSHSNRNDLSLFSCFSGNIKVRIYTLSSMDMNLLLRSSAAVLYKHILIVTYSDYMKNSHFYGVDFTKLNPVCMMHYPDISNDYFKTNKIISPVKMDCYDRKPPFMVSMHYFGNFLKKDKFKTTTFVTLNAIDLPRRNLYLLFFACDKLYKKGITNFTVKVLGDGLPVPERFHNNFEVFGFLEYLNMFKEISDSNFFLALIDQASVEYTNRASGSYGLSYGLKKPIILHRKFSYAPSFNDENSILYNDNDELSDAMEKCINMSNDDYLSLVSSLEISERKLYETSVNNLREALEAPVQYVSYNKLINI